MNKLTKEEALSLPDTQFIEWFRDTYLDMDINDEVIEELKNIVNIYYDPGLVSMAEKINLDQNWVKENDKLLKEKGHVVRLYTRGFDFTINEILRKGEFTNLIKEMTKNMISVLDLAKPYPKKVCLYRGVTKNYVDLFLKNIQPGNMYIDRGFSSQTTSLSIAHVYSISSRYRVSEGKGGILVFCYPKNSKFLYLPIISEVPSHKEILSYPNLFRIC